MCRALPTARAIFLSPAIEVDRGFCQALFGSAADTAGNVDELKAAAKAADAAACKAEFDAIYGKAVEIANRLKARPACALASAKIAINKAALETVAAGKATETTEFTLLFNTHDQKEGG